MGILLDRQPPLEHPPYQRLVALRKGEQTARMKIVDAAGHTILAVASSGWRVEARLATTLDYARFGEATVQFWNVGQGLHATIQSGSGRAGQYQVLTLEVNP